MTTTDAAALQRLGTWLDAYDRTLANGEKPMRCNLGHIADQDAPIYAYASCTNGDLANVSDFALDMPKLAIADLRAVRINAETVVRRNELPPIFGAFAATGVSIKAYVSSPDPGDTAEACRDAYAALLAARTNLAECERRHFQATNGRPA